MPTRATRRAHEGPCRSSTRTARRRPARCRQAVAQNGNWVDAPVQAATVQKLEDVILTKARDLRRQALPGAL
jgi:hypothetical protein